MCLLCQVVCWSNRKVNVKRFTNTLVTFNAAINVFMVRGRFLEARMAERHAPTATASSPRGASE